MNWSWNRVTCLEVLDILTFDTIFCLFVNIFMARRFETQPKGWQNYSKPIGRLEEIERYTGYQSEKIKTLPDEDENIYYPVVYGQETDLKIVTNPIRGLYSIPNSKPNTQSPLMKAPTKPKDAKTLDYGTGDQGCYEILRATTVAQSSPELKHQLANCSRDLHAPVSRSFLRAMSNDFEANKHRVMTSEPTSCCRQLHRHTNLSENNNYERPKKDKETSEGHLVFESEGSDELLDYCTCMCAVKGAFYHFTKDSYNEGHMADEPCSCAGPLNQCLPRWGCLGIAALFLPCLWCYLPIKGCKKLNHLQKCSINTPSIQSRK